ncbi:cysteine desulfurase [Tepidibacter aestuarii]|uniref:cysteine desulfurase n=1 Tax=Tepidibacter aestuarii TaxID=2925782 RepID=UPI0020C0B97D|nr:cysteine desulfurase [Tepidibacter aestuarii]CAH2214774.1 cysteine desulfurase [Tepidibacter aestuarii]
MNSLNVNKIREDFHILKERVNDRQLIYFDNAATTHKPDCVINSIKNYYEKNNSNPHRGSHTLSVRATQYYESAREKVKNFINANSPNEIIFTRNATEALNLLAYSYAMKYVGKDDEIVICISEHHSNILPWQNIAKTKGAKLKYMYLNSDFKLTTEEIQDKITEKTKIVSIAHMSNVLGTIYPIKEIVEYAHKKGSIVIVDGAQSTPHIKIDVQDLDADFFCFSGHKMLGPMGIGVLYGKKELLEITPPFLFGGSMIEYVDKFESTFAPIPQKFEAGTQNVGEAIGLSKAIDYISQIGIDKIHDHEISLVSYALEKMLSIPYVDVYGSKDIKNRGGLISFNIKDVHAHDCASILDSYGIAVRSGHHCAQPFMKYLNLPATCRASFYLYNTKDEIDNFIDNLKNVRRWLGYGS